MPRPFTGLLFMSYRYLYVQYLYVLGSWWLPRYMHLWQNTVLFAGHVDISRLNSPSCRDLWLCAIIKTSAFHCWKSNSFFIDSSHVAIYSQACFSVGTKTQQVAGSDVVDLNNYNIFTAFIFVFLLLYYIFPFSVLLSANSVLKDQAGFIGILSHCQGGIMTYT